MSDGGFQVIAARAVRSEKLRTSPLTDDPLDTMQAVLLVSADDQRMRTGPSQGLCNRTTKNARSADHHCGQSIQPE